MESKPMQPPSYSPVCMIYSQSSLSDLEDIFMNYGDEGQHHGPLKIIRARDESGRWRDTNRTIALVDEFLFDALVKDGLYKPARTPGRPNWDFRIVPYEVRESNLPKEGFKKDLFIRLPKNITLSTKEVEETIAAKMEPLVKFGVLGEKQWSIKIPLRNKSRESGEAHSSCFLAFTNDVPDQTAAMVKAVIDDTYWGSHDETFHCFWARERQEKEKKAFFKHEEEFMEQKNTRFPPSKGKKPQPQKGRGGFPKKKN